MYRAVSLFLISIFFLFGIGGIAYAHQEARSIQKSGDVRLSPNILLNVVPNSSVFGQQATIIWEARGVQNCRASGAWSGSKDTHGTETITFSKAGTQVVKLECRFANGKHVQRASRTVLVRTAPLLDQKQVIISKFAAQRTAMREGESVMVQWETHNAFACHARAPAFWAGMKRTFGREKIQFEYSGTYELPLECWNKNGAVTTARPIILSVLER